jgi:hypothetical protein
MQKEPPDRERRHYNQCDDNDDPMEELIYSAVIGEFTEVHSCLHECRGERYAHRPCGVADNAGIVLSTLCVSNAYIQIIDCQVPSLRIYMRGKEVIKW